MPERHDHGKNLIQIVRIELFAKSFILWMYDVLARHRPTERRSDGLGQLGKWERKIEASSGHQETKTYVGGFS
jgi:hypothetical protein